MHPTNETEHLQATARHFPAIPEAKRQLLKRQVAAHTIPDCLKLRLRIVLLGADRIGHQHVLAALEGKPVHGAEAVRPLP